MLAYMPVCISCQRVTDTPNIIHNSFPCPGPMVSRNPEAPDIDIYTDKKEIQIFLIYKEIQNGAVAKSYMTYGLLIYGEIFAHFLIYEEALPNI